MIITDDNIKIAYDHYETGHDTVIIIAHGFYNNKDTLLFKQMAERFSREYDVICFDFRGHGKSGGLFSWTSFEERDLRAVVDFAKEKGYAKIGVIGFSLGAAVTIIEGSRNHAIDSMIAVSPPYDFWRIDYHFWEKEMLDDFLLNLGIKGKGKCVRPGNPLLEKIPPIKVIDKIAPRPIFLIHGRKDWLIHVKHSRVLFKKARSPKKIEIINNAGHAEKIFDSHPDEFMKLCLAWLSSTMA